jgi:alkylation response protein AidB-like acyl-CoA dehydrogenase
MARVVDPGLTPEQTAVREAAHEFAATVLRPAGAALDALADPAGAIAERSPLWRALRQAYRLGYHRALLPAAFGGLGALEHHVVFEELGWGSAGLAMAIALTGLPAAVAAQTGNEALVAQFVRPFVEDPEARHVGCWAISEPAHGSDAFLVGTPEFRDPRLAGEVIARRDRDHWVLAGEKARWIGNGAIATHAVAFVNLDPACGMAGGGVAIVPLHVRGVSRGRPADLMGLRALGQAAIAFDDVRIPEAWMLTDPTLYDFVLVRTLALAHASMAAIFTGVARAAYEDALDHARTRVQGGKPICEHQLVQQRLFDMFTRVEACRALSRAALAHQHETLPPRLERTIAAKVFCTENAVEVASAAVRLLGGAGVSRAHPVETRFRDARTALAAEGSNDVLALVAARRLIEAAGGPARPRDDA